MCQEETIKYVNNYLVVFESFCTLIPSHLEGKLILTSTDIVLWIDNMFQCISSIQ